LSQRRRHDTKAFLDTVHGRDDLPAEVLEFVEELGIEGVVLKDSGGAARSLLDKFFEIGSSARFAIVLISADDMGASRGQFEEPEVGAKALKYRSRQNAILELGYFYGRLGWDKVFVLEKAPPKKFPDFERPSDLNGVVFDRYDAAGKWKEVVARRLKDGGFVFEMPKPAAR
jgi:predicted nucleotide-binding protein